MRPSAPLAFRWLVAGVVAVLVLVGGAFRAPLAVDALRAQLVLDRASDDGDQTTLGRGRAAVPARATRPSRGNDLLRFGLPLPGRLAARGLAAPHASELTASVDGGSELRPRRVRVHAEHMVFLN